MSLPTFLPYLLIGAVSDNTYSRERITNLVSALNRGTATHFAVRNVTVGD
jgi:hypothetical protein